MWGGQSDSPNCQAHPGIFSANAARRHLLIGTGGWYDLQNITTTALRQGDGYRINGSKMWITNGPSRQYLSSPGEDRCSRETDASGGVPRRNRTRMRKSKLYGSPTNTSAASHASHVYPYYPFAAPGRSVLLVVSYAAII